MKSYREFIAEEIGNKIVQFKRKLAGATDPAEIEKLKKAISDAELQSKQNKTIPNQPNSSSVTSSSQNKTIPAQPNSSSVTSKPTNRLKNFGKGAAKLGAYIGADIAANVAIDQIKDPKTRENTRTSKDFALNTAALYTNPITSLAFGAGGQSSSVPIGTQDAGPYRIQRDKYTGNPEDKTDRFLATGSKDGKYTYNDPKQKIMAYRRDSVGSGKQEDKPFRVGAAREGGQVVPVEYGSVAGEKKVGTAAQAASTTAVQQSRQVASKAKTYGATKGSGLTGIGGPTKVDTKAGTLTTKGKTVKLASTQLVRDPKTGQGRVGDLAYRGGQATYIARASTASRDTGLFSNLSRSTGIGGQRERDQAAAKTEYRTALKNTQAYTKGLGITTKSATSQKLPGYGSAPAPKPTPVPKPKPKPDVSSRRMGNAFGMG